MDDFLELEFALNEADRLQQDAGELLRQQDLRRREDALHLQRLREARQVEEVAPRPRALVLAEERDLFADELREQTQELRTERAQRERMRAELQELAAELLAERSRNEMAEARLRDELRAAQAREETLLQLMENPSDIDAPQIALGQQLESVRNRRERDFLQAAYEARVAEMQAELRESRREASEMQMYLDEARESQRQCCVCYEAANAIVLPCNHTAFCRTCAMRLFQRNEPCAICRRRITSVQLAY